MSDEPLKKKEFKNCSKSEIMFIECEGKPVSVIPGGTVWLTEDDIKKQKYQYKDKRFIDGRIREVGPDTILSSDIVVRNDMSELEIKLMIARLNSAVDLAQKIKRLTSVATVASIMDECKKQDCPYSYIETCLRKLRNLQDDLEIQIKNAKREERRKEKEPLKETENA